MAKKSQSLGRLHLRVFPVRCCGYIDINGNQKYALGHTPIVLVSYLQKSNIKRCVDCVRKHEVTQRKLKTQKGHYHNNLSYMKMIIDSINDTLVRYDKLLMPWQKEFLQTVMETYSNATRNQDKNEDKYG